MLFVSDVENSTSIAPRRSFVRPGVIPTASILWEVIHTSDSNRAVHNNEGMNAFGRRSDSDVSQSVPKHD